MADDARSEASFQSADEEDDDFDFDVGEQDAPPKPSSSSSPVLSPDPGDAQPPGLDDDDANQTEGYERWNLKRDAKKEQLEPIFYRLAEEREHVKISKMFSYVLRHAAHKLDVRIRKDGFVRLRDIMELRNFKPYSLEELMAVVYFDEKERYMMVREFDGELLIRANQGHTMKVVDDDLLLEIVTDPATIPDCVHGTYLVHWPFIKRQGLSKVARNHIHFAMGLPEDGKIRGMRSTAELFVYINVAKAMEDGMIFYRSNNDVVLTQGLDGWMPVKYFSRAVKINYNTCDIEEMEFDPDVPLPTWASELAPSGPGDQGAYLVKNLEALITNCRKRMQEINELKAHSELGRKLSDEEQAKVDQYAEVYTELQSLEQRFRQHKGYRRESAQEKEQKAKEAAEASSVVERKDRAVTPPWERGKSSMESVGTKTTDKEKAEWEALGRRREGATTSAPEKPKKDDPRSAFGRKREPETHIGAASSDSLGRRVGGSDAKDNWRFGGGTSKAEETTSKASPSASSSGGPPRFFNSKLKSTESITPSSGPSWRDRQDDEDPGPKRAPGSSSAFQHKASQDSNAGSWRDPPAPAIGSGTAAPRATPVPQVSQPPLASVGTTPPAPQQMPGLSSAVRDTAAISGSQPTSSAPMWSGGGSQPAAGFQGLNPQAQSFWPGNQMAAAPWMSQLTPQQQQYMMQQQMMQQQMMQGGYGGSCAARDGCGYGCGGCCASAVGGCCSTPGCCGGPGACCSGPGSCCGGPGSCCGGPGGCCGGPGGCSGCFSGCGPGYTCAGCGGCSGCGSGCGGSVPGCGAGNFSGCCGGTGCGCCTGACSPCSGPSGCSACGSSNSPCGNGYSNFASGGPLLGGCPAGGTGRFGAVSSDGGKGACGQTTAAANSYRDPHQGGKFTSAGASNSYDDWQGNSGGSFGYDGDRGGWGGFDDVSQGQSSKKTAGNSGHAKGGSSTGGFGGSTSQGKGKGKEKSRGGGEDDWAALGRFRASAA